MKKTKYELIIGKKPSRRSVRYYFNYGASKDICFQLTKGGAVLFYSAGKDYSDDFMNSHAYYLMREGVKRMVLVSLLLFSKSLQIKNLKVRVNGKNIPEIDENCFRMYSLVDGKLMRPMSQNWNNPAVINNVLKEYKSKYSSGMASVYALLLSKAQSKETQRFIYLWMSMNGFYNTKYNVNDRESLIRIVREYGFGTDALKKTNRDECCKIILRLFKDIDEPMTKEELMTGQYRELGKAISAKVEEAMALPEGSVNPYGFLITDFAYYLRCKMIHGNAPVQLFCYLDDLEYKAMAATNNLLEAFLDEHVTDLYDENNDLELK